MYNSYNKVREIRKNWRLFLYKQDYTHAVTIQAPYIKNPYMFEGRFKKFQELDRVISYFYSVERNADLSGYHVHLLINAYGLTRASLGFALDIKWKDIPYYKPIKKPIQVRNYVTKYMIHDRIHYNVY